MSGWQTDRQTWERGEAVVLPRRGPCCGRVVRAAHAAVVAPELSASSGWEGRAGDAAGAGRACWGHQVCVPLKTVVKAPDVNSLQSGFCAENNPEGIKGAILRSSGKNPTPHAADGCV